MHTTLPCAGTSTGHRGPSCNPSFKPPSNLVDAVYAAPGAGDAQHQPHAARGRPGAVPRAPGCYPARHRPGCSRWCRSVGCCGSRTPGSGTWRGRRASAAVGKAVGEDWVADLVAHPGRRIRVGVDAKVHRLGRPQRMFAVGRRPSAVSQRWPPAAATTKAYSVSGLPPSHGTSARQRCSEPSSPSIAFRHAGQPAPGICSSGSLVVAARRSAASLGQHIQRHGKAIGQRLHLSQV